MRKKLRNWFVTGLLVVVPLGVVIFILRFVYLRLHDFSQPLINLLTKRVTLSLAELEHYGLKILVDLLNLIIQLLVPWGSLLLLFLLILVAGMITSLAIGRRILSWWESLLSRLPVISSIYSAVKQVMETITAGSAKSFKEVVMIEYPRRGIYSLAFVTSEPVGEVQERTGEEVVSVFLPTTPNPTSGFLLLVPVKDIVPLTMTVEQGIKMIISAGIISPPGAKPITPPLLSPGSGSRDSFEDAPSSGIEGKIEREEE